MKYYFGSTSNMTLPFFGPIHLILIISTILIILGIHKYKDKLRKINSIRYIIISILFFNMLTFIIGAIATGNFDIQLHIPIHYCYITGFLFMYMLLKEKKKWFNTLYYAIFFCTITVIIFQDPSVGYDRYQFILLVISHHFLLISSFYTLYVLNYPVNKKGYKSFAKYSIILYSTVFIINKIIGTNYIFNTSFPQFVYDYFPFINYMPPLIWLILLSIPLLACAYIPILQKDKSTK